jgi:hypothetical protein
MLADSGFHDICTGIAAQRKRYSVVIVAANDAVYTITINGTDFEYTADANATTAEIAVGLRDLINAGAEPVLASGSDTPLIIDSTLDGAEGDFTYADGTSGGGSLTETLVSPQSPTFQLGTFVCLDDLRSLPGPADFPVRAPRASADVTGGGFGIIVEQFDNVQVPVETAGYSTSLVIAHNDCMNILREGRCWVVTESAVVARGDVFARFAIGAGGSVLGAIRGDADSASAAQIPRYKFLTSAGAGALVQVECNR